jgi:erythromycin esterase-like protein
LSRLAGARATGDSGAQATRTVLAAKTLLRRFDLLEVPSALFASARDAEMAQMVLDVLATQPESRATLWAHLDHVAREYVVGVETMGSHLAAALGSGYRAYALLAFRGSARAWDRPRKVGVIAQSLLPAPPASLESVLASRSANAHVTYWAFGDTSGEAARWVQGVHLLRSFGAVFMGDLEFSYWDLSGIDGAILFDTVSPTVPTPTGERRAEPKAPTTPTTSATPTTP